MTHHYYRVFDITVKSEILLPELRPGQGTPDVTIRYGNVPDSLEDATVIDEEFQVTPNRFLLDLASSDGVRYLVQDGCEIVVESSPTSHDNVLRLYLLGSCMGVLLHQRGMLPLHGSAIQTSRGAVVFTGDTGRGKSTLAAALQARGYGVLADDISVITSMDQGIPSVAPGARRLRLWADTLHQLGRDPHTLPKVKPDEEKYSLDLGREVVDSPLPLHAIYVLGTHQADEVQLEAVHGVTKLMILRLNVYRLHLSHCMGREKAIFRHGGALVNQVKVCRLLRPETGFFLDEWVDLIERDLALDPDHVYC
ncbi:MAG: hypothetical protein OEU26_36800 [Candidatus Tectomicrobia bacterium]|nr:hypothetical protein [Candidatus Tectomicrobia bacterium]